MSLTLPTNMSNYLQEERLGASLYYFVDMIDSNSNHYYFSNYHTQLDTYVPTNLSVSPAVYEASIYEGIYSVRPVTVIIDNTESHDAAGGIERFIDNFSSNEFETENCIIYLGFEGITSTSDLLEFYDGVMTNFNAGILTFEFDVINKSIIQLPSLPNNKITRANYPNASEKLLGKTIPIVYGRWDNQPSSTTHYGETAMVPGYVIESNLGGSDPYVIIEFGDNELDAVRDVLIYDELLNAVGEVQDDVTTTLSSAQVQIDFRTADDLDFARAIFYLYGDRLTYADDPDTITDSENTIDGDFDTYAVLDDTASLQLGIGFPETRPFPAELLKTIYSDSTGETCYGAVNCYMELSCYPTGSFSGVDYLAIDIPYTGGWFHQELDATALNALSDVDSFNVTLNNLQLCNPRVFDGSTNIFILDENSGATLLNIQPRAGNYSTMTELATEIEFQLSQSGAANTYSVSYQRGNNKVAMKRISGSVNWRPKASGAASDIGYTASAPSYETTGTFTGANYTVLDVPDGDFGALQVMLNLNNGVSGATLNVKGVRMRIYRAYRTGTATEVVGWRREGYERPTTIRRLREDYQARLNSIRELLAGSTYYATLDGYPNNGSYYKTGAGIIISLLSDQLGISAGNIDATDFAAAVSNTQVSDLALYLADESDPVQVMAALAKYSIGFVHIGQDGRYKMKVVESSYSSADFTVYPRDIKTPFNENFRIRRDKLENVTNDVQFYYQFNWATNKYEGSYNATVSNSLNVQQKSIFCPYVVDHDVAATVAAQFGGSGGQFSEMKTLIEITLLDMNFHAVELGDIIAFDSTWRTDLNLSAFGVNIDNLFLMVIYKKYSNREITLRMVEVYDSTS